MLQEQARIREQKIRLNTVLEQSDAIKERTKELKQAPNGGNWLYQVLTSFRDIYPTDLLTALKELATNKDDNAILTENETTPSQLEHIKQLQGLGIFAADIREELIGKILKPLKELEGTRQRSGRKFAIVPLLSMCRIPGRGRTGIFRHGESGTAQEYSTTGDQRSFRPVCAVGQ